ncbi:MAG: riboflavin synthase [Spirochaetia bacterium]|nr:riboflavin synthase [Spirochaetia bacterium]
MFTGIVEETGKIIDIDEKNDGKRITIKADYVLQDLKNGDSIAVNGVCLTVEKNNGSQFTIFSVPETLKLTNIGLLKTGSLVNLERALRASDRLGGHIVQGHVESMANVKNVEKYENHWDVTIEISSPYLVPKGSVAIDGISLTIHELQKNSARFQIIPETIKKTNIPDWVAGYKVNIETDYLVKALDTITKWRSLND